MTARTIQVPQSKTYLDLILDTWAVKASAMASARRECFEVSRVAQRKTMHVQVGGAELQLVEGDIAEQDTDAVVTAAHWELLGGQGERGRLNEDALLVSAYEGSLGLAAAHGLRSISAMSAIVEFLMRPHPLELVRMVLYPRESKAAYRSTRMRFEW